MSWKDWQNNGKDVHSSYTNPLFVDPKNYNFTLQKNAPALQLGFQPISMETVGPRK
ncbi:MAG: hypothetical protein ACR2KZ_17425 [Segetibacter sp.]